MRLACLPWYDLPEIRGATNSLWSCISSLLQKAGVDAPDTLNRQVHYQDQWTSHELLFGQACGYDVLLAFAEELQIVAVPHYSLSGCEGANYRSFVVVREELEADELPDLEGTRCVINTPSSHSGMNVLRAVVAPFARTESFFGEVQISGAHERSLDLLRRGAADVAAIDCVTYGLLAKNRREALAGTRILERTAQVPAPPFVTSSRTPTATLQVLRKALATAVDSAPASLCIERVEVLPISAYEPIARIEREARPIEGFPRVLPSSAPV